MKKLTVLAILYIAVTGFVAAGGLDFHLGAGYHSSYFKDITEINKFDDGLKEAMAMPLGIGGYAGIGVGFVDNRVNMGIEFAPSWDFSLDGNKVSNFALQGRGYLKLKFLDLLTASAFAGYSVNLAGNSDNPGSFVGTPVAGVRLTLFFIYAEYAANLKPTFDGITKHEVGLGFAFFK